MKRKINKARNVLSAILALTFVIIFSSLPALAEETTVTDNVSAAVADNKSAAVTDNESVESDNDYVLSVVVPTTVNISLDPLELNGEGPIYSDLYTIKNCGDTDVLLTFNSIQVIFSNGSDLEALAQPFDEYSKSDMRAIYLVMNFGTSGVSPIVLTDTERSAHVPIRLGSPQSDSEYDSQLSINFSGNLNPYPAVAWGDGDVKILLTYTLKIIPPPKVEVSPSPSSSPETSPAIDTVSPEPSTEAEAAPPEPSAPVEAVTPGPSAAVDTAAPVPSAAVDTAAPGPSAAVDTAAPESSAAVGTAAPESSAASNAAAPEQPVENGSS